VANAQAWNLTTYGMIHHFWSDNVKKKETNTFSTYLPMDLLKFRVGAFFG